MHAYALVRAEKDRLRKWMNDLSAQWFKFRFKGPKDEIIDGKVQLSVRPVQLLEIVFPKECEAEVMSVLNLGSFAGQGRKGRFLEGVAGKLARLLGLNKPLPNERWEKTDKFVDNLWVQGMVLGTKEDVIQPVIDRNVEGEEIL